MRKVSRSLDGRVQGSLNYWLNSHEEEVWRDKKVKPDSILFPNSRESMVYPVHTYKLSELKEIN
jgi:hypothetical protein